MARKTAKKAAPATDEPVEAPATAAPAAEPVPAPVEPEPEPAPLPPPDPRAVKAKAVAEAVAAHTGGRLRWAYYIEDSEPMAVVVGLDGYNDLRLLTVGGSPVFIVTPTEEPDISSGNRGMPAGFTGSCRGVPLGR